MSSCPPKRVTSTWARARSLTLLLPFLVRPSSRCIDADGNSHCTKPFVIKENQCYSQCHLILPLLPSPSPLTPHVPPPARPTGFEWKTKGNVVSHTTLELREVKDNKNIYYYRDTNGDWTADKGGLFYMDFAPKTIGKDNLVEYTVRTCK